MKKKSRNMSSIKKIKNVSKSSNGSTLAPYRGYSSPPSEKVDYLARIIHLLKNLCNIQSLPQFKVLELGIWFVT
jgi:hypothetical protein